MSEDVGELSERERETLRLLLVGHDAKSIALELDLSVHTVNERLREARRKLGVSSSREAARMLAKFEGLDPYLFGDKRFGVGAAAVQVRNIARPNRRNGSGHSLVWLGGGMLTMSLIVAAFVLLSSSHVPTPVPAEVGSSSAMSTKDVPSQERVREVESMAGDVSKFLDKASPDSAQFRDFLVREVYFRGLSQAVIFKVGRDDRIETLATVNVSQRGLEAISGQAVAAASLANHHAVSISIDNWRGTVIRLGKLRNTFLYGG